MRQKKQKKNQKAKEIAANNVSSSPVDERDWNDFLQNLSDRKKSSVSALLRVNSKGYLIPPNEFCIVFNNKIMMDMVVKNDIIKTLEEAASAALGRNVHVQIMMQNDLEAFSKAPKKAEEHNGKSSEDEGFENALNILSKMSEEVGFDFTTEE